MATPVSMDFLAHLLQRGWITEDKANEALDVQRKSRSTIGQVALRCKILTVKQIFEIMRVQNETRQQFGQIAVNLGFMDPDDVDRVLAAQRAETPSIGPILVQIGALTAEQLDTARRTFDDEPGRERARSAAQAAAAVRVITSCND